MLHLSLALRNAFANRRRTMIMLAAICFGCAALIVNGGLIYFIFNGLKEDAVYGRHGHIQIYRQGYQEHHQARPWDFTLPNDEWKGLSRQLLELPHVVDAAPRLDFSGLIVRGSNNVSFLGVGVESAKDASFNRLIRIAEGEGLSEQEPYGVLLGKGLAARAEARAGDYITVMTTTRDGSYNAVDLRVRGIFEGGWREIDDWLMKIPLPTAQSLLRNESIHSLVLLLDDTQATDQAVVQLDALIQRQGLALEHSTWVDLAHFYNQVVSLFSKELNIVKLIIAVVVILSIVNTVSLSIFERTREIGTIMALGAKQRRVLSIFLLEALVIGVAGGILGLLTGAAAAWAISLVGIPMPPPPGSTQPFTAEVDLVPGILLFSFLIAVAAPLVATFYPAFKASRRPVAESLRHI